jgi:hypothetical protein
MGWSSWALAMRVAIIKGQKHGQKYAVKKNHWNGRWYVMPVS